MATTKELIKIILTKPRGKTEISVLTGKREFLADFKEVNKALNVPSFLYWKPGNKAVIVTTYKNWEDVPR
jgi:hypothetical protein